MGFQVIINGEKAWEAADDERVTSVSLGSNKGEIGRQEIEPTQSSVILTVATADARERNLHDVTAVRYPQNVTEADVADAFPAVVPSPTPPPAPVTDEEQARADAAPVAFND